MDKQNSQERPDMNSNGGNSSERKIYPLTYEMLIEEDREIADFLMETFGPKSSTNASETPKTE